MDLAMRKSDYEVVRYCNAINVEKTYSENVQFWKTKIIFFSNFLSVLTVYIVFHIFVRKAFVSYTRLLYLFYFLNRNKNRLLYFWTLSEMTC